MADAAHHGSASNFRKEAEPSRLQAQALASLGVPLGPMTTIPRFDRLSHATGLSLAGSRRSRRRDLNWSARDPSQRRS
jgi:hypothetical protein